MATEQFTLPPLGAPLIVLEEVGSTMDAAREAVRAGAGHGAAVVARSQSAGRGRFRDRRWEGERGRDLFVTFILDAERTGSSAFPLRVGLGLCRAVEGLFGPAGSGAGIRIKWPNDLLIGGRKAAGILCEASGAFLYAGIGVNCGARPFPPGYRRPATSLEEALGRPVDPLDFLPILAGELQSSLFEEGWRTEVERRLHLLGERVAFLEGDPGSGRILEGRLAGLGTGGELLLDLPGEGLVPCSSGELRLASEAGPM